MELLLQVGIYYQAFPWGCLFLLQIVLPKVNLDFFRKAYKVV